MWLKLLFKSLFTLPAALTMLIIVVVNVKLSYTCQDPFLKVYRGHPELLAELRGVRRQIDKGADVDMQAQYPEGYVFMNALHALAWCNYVERFNNPGLQAEAHGAIQQSVDKIFSGSARTTFDEALPLAFGSFYQGWSTFALGKKLSIETEASRDQREVALFKANCEVIARALDSMLYPPSYSGAAWPADVLLCVVSLTVHDHLFTPRYRDVVQTWITNVKANLDENGLVPHSAKIYTGQALEPARGSSQSLMLCLLDQVDAEFARDQFRIYESQFITQRAGVTGVREYVGNNKGTNDLMGFLSNVTNPGDVDSGPVVWQLGSAATIVGIGACYHYDRQDTAARMLAEVNAFGLSLNIGESKTFLLGALPIADAFITWSHSLEKQPVVRSKSFITVHVYSLAVVLILALLFWWIWLPDKPSSEKSLHIPW